MTNPRTLQHDAGGCIQAARVGIIDSPSGKGRGVVAVDDFAAGETVLEFTGTRLSQGEIIDFTHCLEVQPGEYLGPSGAADDFVNHSCTPNCLVASEGGAFFLKALRHIAGGEELTFDYSRSMWNDPTVFRCACGSMACRKEIRGLFRPPPAGL